MTLRVSKRSNQPCSVIFVNFYNFLNNDVIMLSLVSTRNCKLGHDCRRVCSHRRRRRDKTVSSRRCVLGISLVKRLKPLTALSGTVYRLASSMSDHTPVVWLEDCNEEYVVPHISFASFVLLILVINIRWSWKYSTRIFDSNANGRFAESQVPNSTFILGFFPDTVYNYGQVADNSRCQSGL